MLTKERLIEAAGEIADWVLSKAVEDGPDKLYWETQTYIPDTDLAWHVSESLYSGVAGPAYFLDEMARVSGKEAYREAATKALNWVIGRVHHATERSFAGITGHPSVVWPLIRRAEADGDRGALDRAYDLIRACGEPSPDGEIDDVINGRAGSILALLHLYHHTRQASLVPLIAQLTKELIDRAMPFGAGIAWERGERQVRSLCGFSHGAAGIGYTFAELGAYFDLPAFYWLTEQAFTYENHWLAERGFWPDFRRGIYEDKDRREHLEALEKGDTDFFFSGSAMNAWCHGAPGIGLARLRAYQRTGDPRWKEDLQTALHLSEGSVTGDHKGLIYCHGRAGNAELFLEAMAVLDNEQLATTASAPAKTAIEMQANGEIFPAGFRDSTTPCPSLFMGSSGIGLYLLRLADPEAVPCILAPKLGERGGEPVPAPLAELAGDRVRLRRRAFHDAFPRTFAMLPVTQREDAIDFGKNATDFAEALVEAHPDSHGPALRETHQLEHTVFTHDLANSWALNGTLRLFHFEQFRERAEEADEVFAKRTLKLNPAARIFTLEHYRTREGEAIGEAVVMAVAFPEKLVEEKLDPFLHLILSSFDEREGVVVSRVVEKTVEAFETTTEDERARVRELTSKQIRELLGASLLHYVD